MTEQKKIPRRSFFAGLGLAAAAGVAVKLSSRTANSPPDTSGDAKGSGYRLSDHVKKYYRTTTI